MQTLPLVLFAVLLELAVGGFFVLLVADLQGEVGLGFLGLGGVLFLIAGGLAYQLHSGLAISSLLGANQVDLTWLGILVPALQIFLVLLAVYTALVPLRQHRLRRILGAPALVAAVAALVAAAMLYRGPYFAILGAPTSFVAASLTLGAVMAGLLLGHWYLVTPGLSTRPLRRINFLFLTGAALQGLLLPISLGLIGPLAGHVRLAEVLGGFGLILVLRTLMGVVFPLLLAILTWRCCRLRALPSATGLLYVAVASVFFGEVMAKVLFFTTGLPV